MNGYVYDGKDSFIEKYLPNFRTVTVYSNKIIFEFSCQFWMSYYCMCWWYMWRLPVNHNRYKPSGNNKHKSVLFFIKHVYAMIILNHNKENHYQKPLGIFKLFFIPVTTCSVKFKTDIDEYNWSFYLHWWRYGYYTNSYHRFFMFSCFYDFQFPIRIFLRRRSVNSFKLSDVR